MDGLLLFLERQRHLTVSMLLDYYLVRSCHGYCFYISDLVYQVQPDYVLRNTRHDAIRQLSLQGHIIIDTDEKRLKPCVVCAAHNVRSHRGHSIRIRHQCAKCRVALCIGYRDCFTIHHQSLLS